MTFLPLHQHSFAVLAGGVLGGFIAVVVAMLALFHAYHKRQRSLLEMAKNAANKPVLVSAWSL